MGLAIFTLKVSIFLSDSTHTEHYCHLDLIVWTTIPNYMNERSPFTWHCNESEPHKPMQVRVARMSLRYLSQSPTLASLALQSKPQTASLWNSITEQSVWEAAKNRNRMALYMVAGCGRDNTILPKWISSLRQPYGNPTGTLRNCRISSTQCHCKHTYVLWGLI